MMLFANRRYKIHFFLYSAAILPGAVIALLGGSKSYLIGISVLAFSIAVVKFLASDAPLIYSSALFILLTYPYYLVRPRANNAVVDLTSSAVICELLLVGFIFFVSLSTLPRTKRILCTHPEKMIIIYITFAALSSFYSVNPFYGLFHLIKFLSFILLTTYLIQSISNEDFILSFAKLITLFWFFSSVVVTKYMLLFLMGQGEYYGGRLGFQWLTPVWLGILSSLVVILSISVINIRAASMIKCSAAITFLVGLTLMLLSGGRTGYVVTLVFLASLFLLLKRGKTQLILTIITLLSVVVLFVTRHYDVFWGSIHSSRVYMDSTASSTLSGRTILWRYILSTIISNPVRFALGYGYANHRLSNFAVTLYWHAGEPHNAFLAVLYDDGLPGLLMLLSILVATSTHLYKLRKYTNAQRLYPLLAGLFITQVIAGFSLSLYGSTLRLESAMFWFLTLFINSLYRACVMTPINQDQKLR